MKAKIIDFDNKNCGELTLNKDVFGCEVRSDIVKRVAQWQLDKKRSGNHKTKVISEISGTTKKPHKQKGTGNARHGSLRSNIHRGGATVFGPVVRDHSHSLQKKVRKLALKMVVSQKLKEKKLIILSDYKVESHKTKDLLLKLNKLGLVDALFAGVKHDEDGKNFNLAHKNISGVSSIPVEGLNVLDVLRKDFLVLSQNAVKILEERL
ncbi:MAG: 50S ribosomal protein L4 [Rickettsiales bacterium]